MKEVLKTGTDAWETFKAEIVSTYKPGDLITHEYLKTKFNFKTASFSTYDNESAFIQAVELQQFAYMGLIDALRWDLLAEYKLYLRNIRGEGYSFLPPVDQVAYAYDNSLKAIRKEIKEANLIMNNVMSIDAEQQKQDNDARAKFAFLAQLLKGLNK